MKEKELPLIGQNIQKIRKQKQFTLDTLAERSGVSKSMLSQIESEKVNPTVATVWKIARGLGVELDALLKGIDKTMRKFQVIRRENIEIMNATENAPDIYVLSPIEMAEDLEIYLLNFERGAVLHSNPHEPKSEEYLTILEGRIRVQAGENVSELNAGDFIIYNCDVEHTIENIYDGLSKVHMIVRFYKTQWV